jgi:hypothetical protein
MELVQRAQADFSSGTNLPSPEQTVLSASIMPYLYPPWVYYAALRLSTSWIEELVSDMIAIHLVGPAYFYAFTELISPERLSVGVRDHPPSEWRIKLLGDELEYCGYTKVDAQLAQYVKKWSDYGSDTSNISSRTQPIERALENIARDAVQKVVLNIKENVRQAVKNNEYSLELYVKELPPILSMLKNAVPPIEIMDNKSSSSSSLDMVSILNGGWKTKLYGMEALYPLLGAESETEKFEAKHKLNHWILHALEIREIKRLSDGL